MTNNRNRFKSFRRKAARTGYRIISEVGRHSTKSLMKDLKLDSVANVAKKIKSKDFIDTGDFMAVAGDLLTRAKFGRSGLKVNSNVKVRTFRNFITDKLRTERDELSMIEYHSIRSRGAGPSKKDLRSRYHTITAQYGKVTSSRIKKQLSQPNVELSNEVIKDTQTLLSENKRKELVIKSGFNQKCYTILKDIAYVDSKKFTYLYRSKIEDLYVNQQKSAMREYYTSTYCVRNILHFINRSDYFSTTIRIHMVFLKNPETDLNKLIENIFWFSDQLEEPKVKPKKTKTKTKPKTKKTEAKKPKKPKRNETIEEDCSFITDTEKMLKENQVYFPPIETLTSVEGKIKNSFLFDYETSLDDSILFQKECYIGKTYVRTLGPFDVLELDMRTHFGPGLCLNQLSKIHCKNRDLIRPLSHFYIVETIGDRRCRLYKTDSKTDIFYTGYSPTKVSFESKIEMKSLTKGINNSQYMTYMRSKRKEKILRESPLSDYKSDTISGKFNVDYKDIDFTTADDEKKYRIEYDVMGNSNEDQLFSLKRLYKSANVSQDMLDNLSEEDLLEYTTNINNPNIEENREAENDEDIQIDWNEEPSNENEEEDEIIDFD